MQQSDLHAPDELKAEDWAGEMGVKWLANLDRFESMIAPIGTALLDHAAFKPGEHVLDVGCGGGGTTIAIAQEVGSSGFVTGLDISPVLIQASRTRAEKVHANNTSFICADAATAKLEQAPFDRLFSRFGSMFFGEPKAAFFNLHEMVKLGGKIDLAVWALPKENAWMMEMIGVVRSHIDLPPTEPRAPGPFAYGERDYLREILLSGGFEDAEIIEWIGLLPIGGANASPDDAVRFVMSSMAFASHLAEEDVGLRLRIEKELLALFAQYYKPTSGVMMPAKALLVPAKA
ncbi:class I SAM-dependent methyltransferase [Sphingopyxis sp.]|uniref:class I SAM-dependent methyltransferase n=1 Tax=Sphingopyxis sp. TaxID=1908224 RepID=UPI001D3710CE|nr:class I SAM-dependent methyltransferase [Sphingopyxis sp.]MBW8294468.1 class I SAM-dependent methyltransferase [Sphingopyxis sp.]